jgi:hypothetical protein
MFYVVSVMLFMFIPCYVFMLVMLCVLSIYVLCCVMLCYVTLCCVTLTVPSAAARTLHATNPVSLIKTNDVHLHRSLLNMSIISAPF